MIVRKKMFRDCSRFRTICLFVNCSAVLVKTVFKSSFCFSYVLFVAAVAMYHVNNVFRVAVYMMSDKSRFAGRMKCVTGTFVRYVVASPLTSKNVYRFTYNACTVTKLLTNLIVTVYAKLERHISSIEVKLLNL